MTSVKKMFLVWYCRSYESDLILSCLKKQFYQLQATGNKFPIGGYNNNKNIKENDIDHFDWWNIKV